LRLINSPALPLDEIVSTLEQFPDHPLARYEHYYDPNDYVHYWWLNSRFIGLADAALRRIKISSTRGLYIDQTANIEPDSFFSIDSEASQVTLALWEQWRDEVKADNSQFVILHFPRRTDLDSLRAGDGLIYEALHTAGAQQYNFIETIDRFPEEYGSYFAPENHYSARGNRMIAEIVAECIINGIGAETECST
jgi:hypothetical protein